MSEPPRSEPMSTEDDDRAEPFATDRQPPTTSCVCGSTALPVATKPRVDTPEWWDDPEPYWRCVACGARRGDVNDYPWPSGRPPRGPGSCIGGDGPVVAAWDAAGWRLVVRGSISATGVVLAGLHDALRDLGMSDPDLARDAFAVVMNCAGAWEDDATELNGEDSLSFEDWIVLVRDGGDVWVDDAGTIHSG